MGNHIIETPFAFGVEKHHDTASRPGVVGSLGVASGTPALALAMLAVCIGHYNRKHFNVILTDGRACVECFKRTLNHVKGAGSVELDNAEREQHRHVESQTHALGYRAA